MVNVGKKVNSLSGFADGGINSIFRITGDQFATLDTASSNAAGASYATASLNQEAGKKTGIIIKAFFNTETPQS